MSHPLHVVAMGVSGSGKSAVGRPVAERLGFAFAEGDEFHPPDNVATMSAGHPLDDDDRWPWLRALAAWTSERHADGKSTLVACSALKRSYRDVLRDGAPDTLFVHFAGDRALIENRMREREHFFPPALLDSQFDTLQPLEPDERGFVADISRPVADLIDELTEHLHAIEAGTIHR